ncbi:MAG: FAD-dependent oxidoreductase, partial [Bacteroidetes bacterium]
MKVIIVGGGFAGLKMARTLGNKKGIEVTLLDRVNYHQFQPLFYQVATSGLDASNISFPLRKVFHHRKNITIRLGRLLEIVPQENKIKTDIGDMNYDALVIATGADTNFFGNTELKKYAAPMKSTWEALQIRYRLVQNFEDATNIKDPAELQKYMTIVLVGGGPTGVELGGAIAEMRKDVLPKDYPELDFTKMKIYLLEGSPKTLGAMSEKSSKESRFYLERLGVTVMTGTVVKGFDGNEVTLQDGRTIPAKIVIWAAGIKGNVPTGIDPSFVVKGNRIKVDRYNKIIGTNNIYAVGDVAYMETPKYPHGHPQLAAVAIQQGKLLAQNFLQMLRPEPALKEYEYLDKGTMA